MRPLGWGLLRTILLAGLLAGLATSLLQELRVTPLLLEAERLEQRVVHLHADGSEHIHEWTPENGWERRGWTAIANVVTGWAFALLLSAGMLWRGKAVDAASGVTWGLLAFLAFSVAPALGLPPELPGMAAADLADRQVWWLGTVLASVTGLTLLLEGSALWLRVAGGAFLLAPHVLGAPHPVAAESSVPAELSAQFAIASLVTSAGFWATLGALCGWQLHPLLERLRDLSPAPHTTS